MNTTDKLPVEFWQGVKQFNQQEFYACHDTLEALWMEAMEPQRSFYQGILQIAVGFYHLSNSNWRGTVTLLGSGLGRLEGYRPNYGGINVDSFVEDAHVVLEQLQAAGPNQFHSLVPRSQAAGGGSFNGQPLEPEQAAIQQPLFPQLQGIEV